MSLLNVIRRRRQPTIFICYRRYGEGSGYGGRVADKLVKHFGPSECFRDVENIEAGVDFVDTITQAVAACEVLVVVIGPDWATQEDAQNRPRIEDPKDFVRLEVSAALQRDIRVMPVLVGGAQLPGEDNLPEDLRALPRRQAHELTDSRWDYDTDRLIQAIETIGIKGRSPARQEALKLRMRLGAAVLVTLALVLLGMLLAGRLSKTPTDGADVQGTTIEAELLAERERNRALEAERDRVRLEAELEIERTKRLAAEREKAAAANATERTESRQPAVSIPNIAGVWRDSIYPGNGSQITQNGSGFEFTGWGFLENGVRFESSGSGTITVRGFASRYKMTYHTGAISRGDCSGTISSDGSRMDMSCTDSLLGIFPLTSFRQ